MLHPKNSIAIMALDHSRLDLENKSDRIFCLRQVYFTKFGQQVWGRVNQPFIAGLPRARSARGTEPHAHWIWSTSFRLVVTWLTERTIKQYHEALFLSYRPRTECSISQFRNTNCTHSIFRTIEARVLLLAKPLKKSPKSPIRLAGSLFWQVLKSAV